MLNEKYMSVWTKIGIYFILTVFAVVMMAPFIFMVSTSLKTPQEVNAVPPIWIPEKLNWQNYIDVWETVPMGQYLTNTIFVTVVVTLGTLTTSALGAYAFSRLKWIGRDFIFPIYLGTMMVPFS
jgi:multiple sugar transport system permease protein